MRHICPRQHFQQRRFTCVWDCQGGASRPWRNTGRAFYSKQSKVIAAANRPIQDTWWSELFSAGLNSAICNSAASKEAICQSPGPGIDSCSWMKKLIRHWGLLSTDTMNKAPQDPPVPDSENWALKCNHIIKTRFLHFMKKALGWCGWILTGQVKQKPPPTCIYHILAPRHGYKCYVTSL